MNPEETSKKDSLHRVEDTEVILNRRKFLVQAALTGAGLGTVLAGCKKPEPQVCLEFVEPTNSPPPRICLAPVPPTNPPPPRVCLSVAAPPKPKENSP
jgi:hypothetical protein